MYIKKFATIHQYFSRILFTTSEKIILAFTDNKNAFLRSFIPYIIFIIMNLLLFNLGAFFIFLALSMDMIIGIYIYRQNRDREKILKAIEAIKNGAVKTKVDAMSFRGDNIFLAEAVNSIGESIEEAVETSMKDEKLKAKLITNVSHDLKTPLTSIISYIGLIKRQECDNPKISGYIEILDNKANKLRKLTEDLVEASKISSGNVSVNLMILDLAEMINQTIGEFYDRFEEKNLEPIFRTYEKSVLIKADPKHLWRVLENLFNNICKYALKGTKVLIELKQEESENGDKRAVLQIKNVSADKINVEADELSERFIRGDESRTSEGSGLGLSIAKNLTQLQEGEFSIKIDGDVFKVILSFKATT